MNTIEYRLASVDEVTSICQLIRTVFDQFIAPDYSPEGVATFYQVIEPSEMRRRMVEKKHPIYVALSQNEPVGIIEKRGEDNHISLLFVHPSYHKMGIARTLIQKAFENCKGDITVNASPFAKGVYEKLQFTMISGELCKNGITYIPMIREGKKKS